MKKIYNRLIISTFALAAFACSTEDDLVEDWVEVNQPATPTTGDLDLSNYVSVGNSLTAGFADAALYPEAQDVSFPNILATQFQQAGGGAFVQPDISSGNGFGGVNGMSPTGKSFISLAAAQAALAGTGSFGDVIQFTSGTFLNESSNKGGDLNNFGVPGAKVTDLTLAGYGSAQGNPFFAQFASGAATTILADAVSADASFFTLWIGSNDVLGYATSGGDEASSPITAAGDFQTAYGTVLSSLTANGSKGVILNVPPVTIIPFFQIVTTLSGGVNLVPLTRQGQVDSLTAAFNVPITPTFTPSPGYNTLLGEAVAAGEITQADSALRHVSWALGANPPLITDESLAVVDLSSRYGLPAGTVVLPPLRQAKVDPTTGSSDLFPLTALAVLGQEVADGVIVGVTAPAADSLTLTMEEQVQAITAYATYNAIIEGLVAANPNVTLVDVRPLFADLFGLSAAQATGLQLGADAAAAADGELGIDVGGFNLVPLSLSTTELYNSIWSTDGVHPNGRGAAIIANEIIKHINEQYGASVPEVNPLDYPTINAPFN